MSAPTAAQVKAFLVSLLPPGAEKLYSLADGDGGTGDYFAAIADGLKTYGTDLVAALRLEIYPTTVEQNIPDWEAAQGLSDTWTAQSGTTEQRRAQIVSRWREHGASFLDNIRAAVQPFFDYADPSTIQIIECDRSVLRTAHTYGFAAGGIPGPGSYLQTTLVGDNAVASDGGVMLSICITHPTLADLTITLTDPSATVYTIPALTGAAVAAQYRWFIQAAAGEVCNGLWTLEIANAGGNAGTVHVGATQKTDIFVEGIGRVGFTHLQGLGAQQFEYAVVYDPALSNAANVDFEAVRAAIRRVSPAHTLGYLVRVMGGGGLCAIVDDPAAVVGGCVVC